MGDFLSIDLSHMLEEDIIKRSITVRDLYRLKGAEAFQCKKKSGKSDIYIIVQNGKRTNAGRQK